MDNEAAVQKRSQLFHDIGKARKSSVQLEERLHHRIHHHNCHHRHHHQLVKSLRWPFRRALYQHQPYYHIRPQLFYYGRQPLQTSFGNIHHNKFIPFFVTRYKYVPYQISPLMQTFGYSSKPIYIPSNQPQTLAPVQPTPYVHQINSQNVIIPTSHDISVKPVVVHDSGTNIEHISQDDHNYVVPIVTDVQGHDDTSVEPSLRNNTERASTYQSNLEHTTQQENKIDIEEENRSTTESEQEAETHGYTQNDNEEFKFQTEQNKLLTDSSYDSSIIETKHKVLTTSSYYDKDLTEKAYTTGITNQITDSTGNGITKLAGPILKEENLVLTTSSYYEEDLTEKTYTTQRTDQKMDFTEIGATKLSTPILKEGNLKKIPIIPNHPNLETVYDLITDNTPKLDPSLELEESLRPGSTDIVHDDHTYSSNKDHMNMNEDLGYESNEELATHKAFVTETTNFYTNTPRTFNGQTSNELSDHIIDYSTIKSSENAFESDNNDFPVIPPADPKQSIFNSQAGDSTSATPTLGDVSFDKNANQTIEPLESFTDLLEDDSTDDRTASEIHVPTTELFHSGDGIEKYDDVKHSTEQETKFNSIGSFDGTESSSEVDVGVKDDLMKIRNSTSMGIKKNPPGYAHEKLEELSNFKTETYQNVYTIVTTTELPIFKDITVTDNYIDEFPTLKIHTHSIMPTSLASETSSSDADYTKDYEKAPSRLGLDIDSAVSTPVSLYKDLTETDQFSATVEGTLSEFANKGYSATEDMNHDITHDYTIIDDKATTIFEDESKHSVVMKNEIGSLEETTSNYPSTSLNREKTIESVGGINFPNEAQDTYSTVYTENPEYDSYMKSMKTENIGISNSTESSTLKLSNLEPVRTESIEQWRLEEINASRSEIVTPTEMSSFHYDIMNEKHSLVSGESKLEEATTNYYYLDNEETHADYTTSKINSMGIDIFQEIELTTVIPGKDMGESFLGTERNIEESSSESNVLFPEEMPPITENFLDYTASKMNGKHQLINSMEESSTSFKRFGGNMFDASSKASTELTTAFEDVTEGPFHSKYQNKEQGLTLGTDIPERGSFPNEILGKSTSIPSSEGIQYSTIMKDDDSEKTSYSSLWRELIDLRVDPVTTDMLNEFKSEINFPDPNNGTDRDNNFSDTGESNSSGFWFTENEINKEYDFISNLNSSTGMTSPDSEGKLSKEIEGLGTTLPMLWFNPFTVEFSNEKTINRDKLPVEEMDDNLNVQQGTERYLVTKISESGTERSGSEADILELETERSVSGTEESEAGIERSEPGTIRVSVTAVPEFGTERLVSGTKISWQGTEKSQSETEISEPGTERLSVTSISELGTERSKPASEISGTEMLELKTERLVSGTEKSWPGTENPASGIEGSEPGTGRLTVTELSELGTERSETGTESSVTKISESRTEIFESGPGILQFGTERSSVNEVSEPLTGRSESETERSSVNEVLEPVTGKSESETESSSVMEILESETERSGPSNTISGESLSNQTAVVLNSIKFDEIHKKDGDNSDGVLRFNEELDTLSSSEYTTKNEEYNDIERDQKEKDLEINYVTLDGFELITRTQEHDSLEITTEQLRLEVEPLNTENYSAIKTHNLNMNKWNNPVNESDYIETSTERIFGDLITEKTFPDNNEKVETNSVDKLPIESEFSPFHLSLLNTGTGNNEAINKTLEIEHTDKYPIIEELTFYNMKNVEENSSNDIFANLNKKTNETSLLSGNEFIDIDDDTFPNDYEYIGSIRSESNILNYLATDNSGNNMTNTTSLQNNITKQNNQLQKLKYIVKRDVMSINVSQSEELEESKSDEKEESPDPSEVLGTLRMNSKTSYQGDEAYNMDEDYGGDYDNIYDDPNPLDLSEEKEDEDETLANFDSGPSIMELVLKNTRLNQHF